MPDPSEQPTQSFSSKPVSRTPAVDSSSLANSSSWMVAGLLIIGLLGAGLAALRPQLWLMLDGMRPVEHMQIIYTPLVTLPAYHLIGTLELTETLHPVSQLPANAITSRAQLVSAVSLAPLRAGNPITTGQVLAISDKTPISDAVVVAVQGGADLAFGGMLQTGASIACWSGNREIIEQALVLATRRVEAATGPPSYVVILAIPRDRRDEIALAVSARNLSFSLKP